MRWHVLGLVAVAALAGGIAGGMTATLGDDPAPSAVGQCPAPAADPLVDAVAAVRDSTVAVRASWTEFDAHGAAVQGDMVGSGFAFAPGGLVATNAHLVEQGGAVIVTLPDGDELDGTVLGVDAEHDLAVVRVDADLQPADLGCSADLRVGDEVATVGNALGLGEQLSASAGIVAALGRDLRTEGGRSYHDLVQLDVALNEGSSGGPIVDREGLVVAIAAAGDTSGAGVGFAIGIDDALPVLEDLAAAVR